MKRPAPRCYQILQRTILGLLALPAAAAAQPPDPPSAGEVQPVPVAPAADPAPAAAPPPCSSAGHRQFDFWVGQWRVSAAADGKPAGANRIEKILGGCALHESWTGASGYRGQSLNAWDASRSVWHQTWVDQAGQVLLLEGSLVQGSMVLFGEAPSADATVRHRITWTPAADGSVRQTWDSSADGGRTWKTEFDGIYRRDS